MQALIKSAIVAHEKAKDVRVEPSIPILYFGNYDAYRNSDDHRIITVGLNPGSAAFPEGNRFAKFPAFEESKSHKKAWDGYFDICKRDDETWFRNLDCILHGFNASFYSGSKNTALHTDILSPVATQDSWSDLGTRQQEQLAKDGTQLWNELVEFLEPQIILISVAKRYRERIAFEFVKEWETVYTVPRTNPYVFEHAVIKVGRADVDVLFGRAAQVPFGTLSADIKKTIGKSVKNKLTNW